MSYNVKQSRVLPALISPFDANDRIDFKVFETLLHHFRAAGVTGRVLNGSTRGYFSQSTEERRQVLQFVKDFARPGEIFIAGTNAPATRGLSASMKAPGFCYAPSTSPHATRVGSSWFPAPTTSRSTSCSGGRGVDLRAVELHGAALCKRALGDTQALLAEIGASGEITESGCLSLYADETEFRADRDHIEILERFGFDHEVIGGNALRDLEPELTPGVAKAVLLPDNRSLRDHHTFVLKLAERFEGLGGEIRRAEVIGFERGAGITGVRLKGGRMRSCSAPAPSPRGSRSFWASRSRWRPNAANTPRSWPPASRSPIRSTGPTAPSW